MYSDKTLTCADCGQEFVFTASEQDFYAQRGFTEPRRCPSCRASRKAARNAEGGGIVRRLQRRRRLLGRRLRGRVQQRLRLARPRPPRDVLGDLLELRQGSPGPVPPDQRQARLLQRLLPEHARRLTQTLSVRADQRPAEPASIRDPGRQPTRVVRFSWPGGGAAPAARAEFDAVDAPSRVVGLATGVSAIAARGVHAFALVDGHVRCWGDNNDGQLGDGTTNARTAPVEVPGIGRVSAIATGGERTCAILACGDAECWGWNMRGQLGYGSTIDRHGPV